MYVSQKLLAFNYVYSAWLYWAILVRTVLSIRAYQLCKGHPGLRVYYHLFAGAWRSIKDFAIYVVYIVMLIGGVIVAYFQVRTARAQVYVRQFVA